ncbi:cell wall-binding repeat-containing protein [Clostridium thailandense]|uniref:cell wall-binding repeat-containing protein n=1 Tax=Clostridium thailandense TaxID=2794346 RepID=UPI003988C9D4
MNKSELVGVLKSKKLVLLVAAAAVAGTLGTIKVQASPVVTRYNGMDRYETAAKVCEDGWKQDTDYAVIVNGENFPDALSAAPLAKKYDAPILLTGAEILNPYTSSELTRLNVKNVFIIGGKGVVSQSIEDALKAKKIKVTRLGGSDRYETAIQVAAKIGKHDEVAIINGNNFKDGMSIASIAALKGMPIILTDGTSLSSSVKKYLGNTSKMSQIYVIGDQNIISDNAISGLSNVKRIGYGNDYERNTSIIEAFQNEVDTNTLYIASAKDFPDSLGASALAPSTSSPVLFVDSPMDNSTQDFLKKHIVTKLKILGGNGSVSYATELAAQDLPLAVGSTQNITDTILQNEKYTPRQTIIITATDGTKKEVAVDWNLTKVNTTKPGIYNFLGKINGTDKTVYATLTVKPIPYKINDITDTADSRETYQIPSTVTAQMTDGTWAEVPVNWDYGTQSSNKPGVYVFNGTVDKYSKKVKLTLNINPASIVASIPDFKKVFATTDEMNDYISSDMPSQVIALMQDGSSTAFDVNWDAASTLIKGSRKGTHILKGTVPDCGKRVSYLMIVTSEGGVDLDPNNSGNSGNNGGNSNSPSRDIGELSPIVQGDVYPTQITDPLTNKKVKVTWKTGVSIGTSSNITTDASQYLDDCRIATMRLEGVTSNGTKVAATIGIIPKVIGITSDYTNPNATNTSYSPTTPIPITISASGVIKMEDIKLYAIISNPQGVTPLYKLVKVSLWNPPVISPSDSASYTVQATIDYYNSGVPVPVVIKVQ